MDGTVVSVIARQGQTLNANQQAPIILRIADLDTMTVWTQVSEADIGKLEIGMDAYFTTLGYADRRWEGRLRQILPTPEGSEEHTSELQSLMRISYAGFCLKKQTNNHTTYQRH